MNLVLTAVCAAVGSLEGCAQVLAMVPEERDWKISFRPILPVADKESIAPMTFAIWWSPSKQYDHGTWQMPEAGMGVDTPSIVTFGPQTW